GIRAFHVTGVQTCALPILLQNSADAPIEAGACSAPPDGQGNYTYGYGYLNVLAAGTLTCGTVEYGTLQGHVYDNYGAPIEGATAIGRAWGRARERGGVALG